ncbi:hypothetical protein EV361DRAFT_901626 [Lentinula raphanica]|uniref:Uncharacterized protein n=1 Tax=Lentinula raphanica TaxID=153919 RepID=A0AA38UCE3_9AGAR|nr:hypothetical protein C8R42DRAFT_674822 [Lentinula raphanica]KAJ3777659.1 hypothetical protein FB446DRAFT_716485 [Lentinula raphanica]KAJ3817523.1 hypothetical protein F5880DRAFT_1604027 [Lentinula raphanica]KAJ3837102.1 hypothetical protein F5878DRAFT_623380 [Lentinula raphanica]KAJ3973118.1 hypothetical protein EV361DRAFT_901626 [Lentinula raphanica]
MCYVLRINNEFSCGHQVTFRRERIDCNSANCVLSASHQLDCRECYSTCRQSLMEEQAWTSGRVHRPCESCLAGK